MATLTPLPTDLRLRCEVLLSKEFGVGSPSELTSAERYRAYELMKGEIEMAARSLKQFEQDIQQIADFLQI